MAMQQTRIDTVVIGAGQAGLTMSHHLSSRNVPHVVLERARVGERWRTERWDSLRFQFPNKYVRLPGFDYDGDDPSGFMDSSGVVSVLERYANHIAAPVRSGVNVRSVDRATDGKFLVACDHFELLANNVVLATGPYQRPIVPDVSTQLPTGMTQLTASSFTNAGALPDGAVLVVGSGGSGVQIAEDLIAAGREVYLSVGHHRRVPRRYRGRDVTDWFEELGLLAAPVERAMIDHAPLLTGVDGGYDVDLRSLAKRGGRLLGRLEAVRDGQLVLGDGLLADIANADESFQRTIGGIEARLVELGLDKTAPPPDPLPDPGPLPPPSPPTVGIESAGISSVIWATGYGLDFSWVHCGQFDDDGTPSHERGVSPVPGLYFLGLSFLLNARSSVFWGVGDDAQYLAEHLVAR
ncbi:MAG: flavin-containing monooxygenase [Acidimicrobiales bacterium]